MGFVTKPAKIGRPKSPNPINIRTGVRLDAKTMKRLEEYCKEHEITKGEAIRKGIHLLLDTNDKK